MDDDTSTSDGTGRSAATPAERRYALAVWPSTSTERWHAELSAAGEPPRRFDRVFDLVVYLTAFDRPASGLR